MSEKNYFVGDRFSRLGGVYNGEKYILAECRADEVVLISLKTGDRWTDPVKVKNSIKMTELDYIEFTGDLPFEKVSK